MVKKIRLKAKKKRTQAQTPAPKKDRIIGSKKNPKGSASGARGGIKISDRHGFQKILSILLRQAYWIFFLAIDLFAYDIKFLSSVDDTSDQTDKAKAGCQLHKP